MYLFLARLSLKISKFVENYRLKKEMNNQIKREKRFCRIVAQLNRLMDDSSADEDVFTSIFYDGQNLSLQVFDSVTKRSLFVFSYPFTFAVSLQTSSTSIPEDEDDDEDSEE